MPNLDEFEVFGWLEDKLDRRMLDLFISDAMFHHNASYEDAASICKNGVLSLADQTKMNIRDHTKEELIRMDDYESHVNGSDKVSLSKVGLDDIYPGEDVYDPSQPIYVDFLISDDIKASRSSIHYGNEFLSSSIDRSKLRALDIRLLKLIKKGCSARDIVSKYNHLLDAIDVIIEDKLGIPVREASYDEIYSLDIESLKREGKIIIKERAS